MRAKDHHWSGYPGAYCFKCGCEDLLEIAIGSCYYDPYTDIWDTEEHKKEYTNKPCPVEGILKWNMELNKFVLVKENRKEGK